MAQKEVEPFRQPPLERNGIAVLVSNLHLYASTIEISRRKRREITVQVEWQG